MIILDQELVPNFRYHLILLLLLLLGGGGSLKRSYGSVITCPIGMKLKQYFPLSDGFRFYIFEFRRNAGNFLPYLQQIIQYIHIINIQQNN